MTYKVICWPSNQEFLIMCTNTGSGFTKHSVPSKIGKFLVQLVCRLHFTLFSDYTVKKGKKDLIWSSGYSTLPIGVSANGCPSLSRLYPILSPKSVGIGSSFLVTHNV